jgi:uncharacterized integral membrane protein
MYLYKDGRKIRSDEHFKILKMEVPKWAAIVGGVLLLLIIIVIIMMIMKHGKTARRR